MTISLTVNDIDYDVQSPPDTPLLWVLRDELKLTGTKYGCGIAQCGACTVHMNGYAIRSCQVPVADAEYESTVTIEAASSPETVAVKQAWSELDVVQCGFCQAGQIMQAASLLRVKPRPTDDDIDVMMGGSACRCATYSRIRAAIHRAADILEA